MGIYIHIATQSYIPRRSDKNNHFEIRSDWWIGRNYQTNQKGGFLSQFIYSLNSDFEIHHLLTCIFKR